MMFNFLQGRRVCILLGKEVKGKKKKKAKQNQRKRRRGERSCLKSVVQL